MMHSKTAIIWQYPKKGSSSSRRDSETGSNPLKMSVKASATTSTVLVGGCFDIIHYGHLQFLRSAKNLGNYLVVALEPDEKILQTKGRAPIHTIAQRAEILSELKMVDEIVLLPLLHSYEDYQALVAAIKPVYIAVTENDTQLQNKRKQVESIGGELVVVTKQIETMSSSRIIHDNAVYAND